MNDRLDELRNLATHERGVLDHYREMIGGEDEQIVQPALAASRSTKQVMIVGYADLWNWTGNGLVCKDVDREGTAIGDEFNVYAFSHPPIDGIHGLQTLWDCDPLPLPGELIDIEYRERVIGGGEQPVTGWWAVDRFDAFECEGECV